MAEIFQPPPPNPFMGGAQPLAERQLVPSAPPTPPTVNNPPFGQLYTIFEPWIDAFVMPQRAAQIAAIIPVAITPAAYVPPPDTAVQTSIVQAWQVPDAPLPQRGAQIAPLIPVTPADNPPFRHLDTCQLSQLDGFPAASTRLAQPRKRVREVRKHMDQSQSPGISLETAAVRRIVLHREGCDSGRRAGVTSIEQLFAHRTRDERVI